MDQSYLGNSTIVVNTIASPAAAEFWKASASEGSEYEVRIIRHTKS
jgi:hypothetical protein